MKTYRNSAPESLISTIVYTTGPESTGPKTGTDEALETLYYVVVTTATNALRAPRLPTIEAK